MKQEDVDVNAKDALSEYQRGVSAWNFDVEDLKFQASLVSTREEDEIQEIKEEEDSVKYHTNHKVVSSSVVKQEATGDNSSRGKLVVNDVLVVESQTKNGKVSDSDLFQTDNQVNTGVKGGSRADLAPPVVEKDVAQAKTRTQTGRARQTQSGPLIPGAVLSHSQSERVRNLESAQMQISSVENCTLHRHLALVLFGIRNKTLEDFLDMAHNVCIMVNLVFMCVSRCSILGYADSNLIAYLFINASSSFSNSVFCLPFFLEVSLTCRLFASSSLFEIENQPLAEKVQQDIPLCSASRRNSQGHTEEVCQCGNLIPSKCGEIVIVFQPNSQPAKEIGNSNVPASVLMPQLQNLFQQTSIQQAELVVSERERMLLTKISELQARMISLTDELTAEKVKYTQMMEIDEKEIHDFQVKFETLKCLHLCNFRVKRVGRMERCSSYFWNNGLWSKLCLKGFQPCSTMNAVVIV
ncbi:hypothetical protein Sango_1274700 [Sesamum angolense]|uniref:Uncharacterized protein n=1 Tax=Sesamum angolense TaxID=2727404 RepID=A0AAE1WRM3_9LAMI|nr:hypothetical protein Sango_1274700 [Sesamum angolense]